MKPIVIRGSEDKPKVMEIIGQQGQKIGEYVERKRKREAYVQLLEVAQNDHVQMSGMR